MVLLSFKEALKKTKSQIDEMMIPVRVKQNKLKGETELAKLEEEMLKCESDLQELTVAHPIDFSKLIEKMDDMAMLERRQRQLKKILDELFPVE